MPSSHPGIEITFFQFARTQNERDKVYGAQQDAIAIDAPGLHQLHQSSKSHCQSVNVAATSVWASVADGVFVSKNPAYASRTFLETLHAFQAGGKSRFESMSTSSDLAIHARRAKIEWQRLHSNRRTRGSATTLASLTLRNDRVCAINCGDSRIWRIRQTSNATVEISQISRDHTIWQQMIDEGDAQADMNPSSMYLSLTHHLALGDDEGYDDFEPSDDIESSESECSASADGEWLHVWYGEHQHGDIYLLATDGLHGTVENFDLANRWNPSKSLLTNLQMLEHAWRESGSSDDISVVAIASLSP